MWVEPETGHSLKYDGCQAYYVSKNGQSWCLLS